MNTENAARSHLLTGDRLTPLEATALHGYAHLASLVHTLRKEGFVVKSRSVTYAAVRERLGNVGVILDPPPNLPIREITFTEYWVGR
jgi:hypothetical protein